MNTPGNSRKSRRPAVGELVDGRFSLLEELGTGGMASVFLANHVYLEREVALKLLHVAAEEADMGERFMTEARLAARLDHPHVAHVIDFGVDDERELPFLVMERLTGRDLEARLVEQGPVTPEQARQILHQTLDALSAAHDLGIVHKDLKPSNVFLVDDRADALGDVKLLDFGIAHAIDSNHRYTAVGELSGTVGYMPPEYVNEAAVTPAFDVYQVGLLLIEMLTGGHAINGDTPMAIMMKQANGELDIPDWIRESTMWPLLERAVAPDPADRFRNAEQMLTALQAQPEAFDVEATPADATRSPSQTSLGEELEAWWDGESDEIDSDADPASAPSAASRPEDLAEASQPRSAKAVVRGAGAPTTIATIARRRIPWPLAVLLLAILAGAIVLVIVWQVADTGDEAEVVRASIPASDAPTRRSSAPTPVRGEDEIDVTEITAARPIVGTRANELATFSLYGLALGLTRGVFRPAESASTGTSGVGDGESKLDNRRPDDEGRSRRPDGGRSLDDEGDEDDGFIVIP